MEKTIEKNLNLLMDLQQLDKQIYDIFQVRGSLPQEVKKLEEKTTLLEEEIKACQENTKHLEVNIASLRLKIKEIEVVVKRYEEQQMNVRNNREYDAITKEIELNHLDIQLADKKIRESYATIEKNQETILALQQQIESINKLLKTKKADLDLIVGDSKEEEEKLLKKRQKVQNAIDAVFNQNYEQIKNSFPNKIAVVSVKKNACGGCFTVICPQIQAEIKEKRDIFYCEHCGRILAEVHASSMALVAEEE